MSSLASLPLKEIKKMAQGRKIKQYYILPKDKLVELLSLPETPLSYRIEKMTMTELREKAKERGLRGYWSLNKQQLTRVLFPKDDDTIENAATHQEKKNNGEASEHQQPKEENTNDIGIKMMENA